MAEEIKELTKGEILGRALTHYKKWRKLPFGDKIPLTKVDFAHQYGITTTTLDSWDKKLDKREDSTPKKILEEIEEGDMLIRQIKEMDDAVFNAGKNKTVARMAELWYKRKGLLVEKSEGKIGLTADERLSRELEAERQLREFEDGRGTGYRVEEVPKELPLLPE